MTNKARSLLIRLGIAHFLVQSQFWFPVWVLFLRHRGFTLGQIAAADAFFRVMVVLLEFPTGMLGDRLGRRRTYLLSCVFATLAYASLVVVYNMPLLFVCWALWAVFIALASGTDTAYHYELVAGHRPPAAVPYLMGVFRAVSAGALLLSHLSAGYLYSVHPALPFLCNAAFAVLAGAVIVSMPATVPGKRRSFARMLARTWRIVRSDRGAAVPVVLSSALLAYFWTTTLLYQPLLEALGFTPGSFGLVYVVISGAGIGAGLATGYLITRLGGSRLIVWGTAGMVVAVAAVGGGSAATCIIGLSVLSGCFYLADETLKLLLNREIGDSIRASILSLSSFLGSLLLIVSRPGIAMLAQHWSIRFAFQVWSAAGLIVLAVVIVAVWWRE